MTYMEIFEVIAGVCVFFLVLDAILYFWKKHLEDKLKQEKSKQDNMNERFDFMVKNLNSQNYKVLITSGARVVEVNHNREEIEKLNKLQDKFKEQIQPTDEVIDKIQRTRTLASKEIRKKHELMLKIICYGFIKSEYWELVEGIKLAFNDAGLEFKAPQNTDELNDLYEQHFYTQVK